MQTEQQWPEYIGRIQESQIEISTDRMRGLAALLDYPELPWPVGQVPPTGHWCAIFPYTQQSKLGHDGHEQRGQFYPPIPYPRRMWAGGRIHFLQPLQIGVPVTHRAIIKQIENKQGKTGQMIFLTICHEYLQGDVLMLQEDQSLVYRDVPTTAVKKPVNKTRQDTESLQQHDWSKTIIPDTSLLFRYSAVSFNGHRIHYDQDYVREEGYPGLLVHAPLTATMLIDLFQQANPGVAIRRFEFTARSPMYVGYPFTISGKQQRDGIVSLWAEDCEGTVSMSAELETGGENTDI
jgi:3-methylfumaryl-CoA hydratase